MEQHLWRYLSHRGNFSRSLWSTKTPSALLNTKIFQFSKSGLMLPYWGYWSLRNWKCLKYEHRQRYGPILDMTCFTDYIWGGRRALITMKFLQACFSDVLSPLKQVVCLQNKFFLKTSLRCLISAITFLRVHQDWFRCFWHVKQIFSFLFSNFQPCFHMHLSLELFHLGFVP